MAGQDEGAQRARCVCPCGEPPHRARGGRGVVLAHVEVAVARELDDAALRDGAGRQLLVVDRGGAGHVEGRPPGVRQALAEVDLVGVDEEGGVEPADPARRVDADEHRRALGPVDLSRALAAALDGEPTVQEERVRQRGGRRGEAPRGRLLAAVGP